MHPPLHADFVIVAQDIKRTLLDRASEKLSVLQLQSALLSANAALSRFSSQALSGIPPIEATECHFWPHSLLGTGTANIALGSIVSSIQQVMGEAHIPERLASLHDRTDNLPDVSELTLGTRLLSFDLLRETELADGCIETVPLVTYFSGRDGFSSQVKSLSAPLTTLAECNSRRSSLLTVTHEISHIFVQAALTVLMPALDDPKALEWARRLLSARDTTKSYLESARKLLLEAIVGMEIVSRGMRMEEEEISPALPSMLERWRHELQEILVHTFDFLYFYAGDPDFYVRSIWHSWCAIPGIVDRVPEYLMRTLCAVSANLLDADPKVRFTAALAHSREILGDISKEIGHTPNYVEKAIAHIEDVSGDGARLELMEREYSLRLYLTRLVRIFLYSDDLSARLFADVHGVSGDGQLGKRLLHFDLNPIGNPLRFLKDALKVRPSEAESLWVLHCLAFDAPRLGSQGQ